MKLLTAQKLLQKYSAEYFKEASTFGALSTETVLWLLDNGRIYRLETDETLFEIDERGDNFFIILQGSFAYYKSHLQQYAFIRDYKVGEQIGFMSMIALHNRVGTAVANEDSLVLEISSAVFQQLHNIAPSDFGMLMMNLAREMARSLRKGDNLIVDKTAASGKVGYRSASRSKLKQLRFNDHQRNRE
ncbi:Crp/Fnr family transcriptional regulator [Amphritea sp. HPY]|uniref:Crp/Fnr family transcriptional regulator n=1 Tax=Amphritea sp. HPY TaxID=3421652 RepID=UPI003D7C7236